MRNHLPINNPNPINYLESMEKKEKCKEGKHKTKYMYRLNDGLYCEKHYLPAYMKQRIKLDVAEFPKP